MISRQLTLLNKAIIAASLALVGRELLRRAGQASITAVRCGLMGTAIARQYASFASADDLFGYIRGLSTLKEKIA